MARDSSAVTAEPRRESVGRVKSHLRTGLGNSPECMVCPHTSEARGGDHPEGHGRGAGEAGTDDGDRGTASGGPSDNAQTGDDRLVAF
jgi:hypothetical protein